MAGMPDEKVPEPTPPPIDETVMMSPVSQASVLLQRYEILVELGRGGNSARLASKLRDKLGPLEA
jgi:hypothetical protein